MIKLSFRLYFLFHFFFMVNVVDAQESSYVSADSLVQMEVKRENKTILVSLFFQTTAALDRLIVERSVQSGTGFTLCKYLKTNNSTSDVITLSFRDNYASYILEYYYRLKTISIDGVERSYPALRLPALIDVKTQ